MAEYSRLFQGRDSAVLELGVGEQVRPVAPRALEGLLVAPGVHGAVVAAGEDLRHGAALEDPAVASLGEEPQPRHEGAGFRDFDASTLRRYEKRGYCVQYRESDLEFASRLMEEEGIFLQQHR